MNARTTAAAPKAAASISTHATSNAYKPRPFAPMAENPVHEHHGGEMDAPAAPGHGHDFGAISLFPPAAEGLSQACPDICQSCPTRPGPAERLQAKGGSCCGGCSGNSREKGEQPQTKLTVGTPGDKYEREADRVADAVMDMPEPRGRMGSPITTPAAKPAAPVPLQREEAPEEEQAAPKLLQRQEAPEEEEAATKLLQRQEAPEEEEAAPKLLQRQEAPEEEEAAPKLLQREEEQAAAKEQPGGTPRVSPGVEKSIASMRGGGQPMADSSRSFFEPRFGRDFSGVRLHTGARAAEASAGIQARAFTLGSDVFFNSGQYQPDTDSGKRLIAHELTHVGQQGGARRKPASESKSQLLKQGQEGESLAQTGDTIHCAKPRSVSDLDNIPGEEKGKILGGEVNNDSDTDWVISGATNSEEKHFMKLPAGKNSDDLPQVEKALKGDVDGVWPAGKEIKNSETGKVVTTGAFKLRDHRNTDINGEKGVYKISDFTIYKSSNDPVFEDAQWHLPAKYRKR